jgi:hypothetical protein
MNILIPNVTKPRYAHMSDNEEYRADVEIADNYHLENQVEHYNLGCTELLAMMLDLGDVASIGDDGKPQVNIKYLKLLDKLVKLSHSYIPSLDIYA